MAIGNQWFGRTLWALAACLWLAVLPAMAADVVVIARNGASDTESLLDRLTARAHQLGTPLLAAVARREKGGPTLAGPPLVQIGGALRL
jgi:hypothetical protein